MRPFGWDLPPGVTNRMIDEHFGEECCEDCCDDDSLCEDCACHWDEDEWAAQKADMRD